MILLLKGSKKVNIANEGGIECVLATLDNALKANTVANLGDEAGNSVKVDPKDVVTIFI